MFWHKRNADRNKNQQKKGNLLDRYVGIQHVALWSDYKQENAEDGKVRWQSKFQNLSAKINQIWTTDIINPMTMPELLFNPAKYHLKLPIWNHDITLTSS